MATYTKLEDKVNNRKIQVESAVRDGAGKNIENNYAKQNAYYDTLGAGYADVAKDIQSDREIEDADVACPPIVFGATGGGAEIESGFSEFKYLEGNSIVWNQLLNPLTFSSSLTVNGITFTRNNDGGITISGVASATANFISSATLKFRLGDIVWFKGKIDGIIFANHKNGNYIHNMRTINSTTGTDIQLRISVLSDADFTTPVTIYPQIFNLTTMNYPTAGLTNNEIMANFISDYPLNYYTYDSGTILSAKTNALISVGKNQFSGINEFIRVLPNTEYELSGITAGGYIEEYDADKNLIQTSTEITSTTDITLTANTYYVKIQATTYGDIMFYITYETYNEPYVAYEKDITTLPNIELRSIGNIRDIAYQQGGGLRKLGIVKLKDLTWAYDSGWGGLKAWIDNFKVSNSSSQKPNIICNKYITANNYNEYSQTVSIYIATTIVSSNRNILVHGVGSDPVEFVNSLTDNDYFVYELITPTEITDTENPGWAGNIKVDNFGTLQFTTDPEQIPQIEQPYFIRYTVNLVEFLDSTYVRTGGDANNIALTADHYTKQQTDAIVDDLKSDIEDGQIVAGQALTSKAINPVSEESGTIQEAPFIIQGTGTNNNTSPVDTSPVGKQLEKQGNSIVYNQLIKNGNFSSSSGWFTDDVSMSISNNIATISTTDTTGSIHRSDVSLINGHKYIMSAVFKSSVATTNTRIRLLSGSSWQEIVVAYSLTTSKTYYSKLITCSLNTTTSGGLYIYPNNTSGGLGENETLQISNVCLIDLTQWFNGDIPSDLLSHPEHFSWYYNADLSYNVGQIKDCNGRYLECGQGRQIWDEQWEQGIYDSQGQPQLAGNSIRNKNKIKVIPNTVYYVYKPTAAGLGIGIHFWDDNNFLGGSGLTDNKFTTPSNCTYINFYISGYGSNSYQNNVTISLYYTTGDGYDEYYPYVPPVTYDTGTEVLRSIPVAGGDDIKDIKLPSNVITRKVYKYTFTGEETMSLGSTVTSGVYSVNIIIPDVTIKSVANSVVFDSINDTGYLNKSADNIYLKQEGICRSDTGNGVKIYDANIQTTTAMKTKVAGKTIYLELATPTTEQGTAFSENIQINDYSYTAWKDTDGNYVSVPQGVKIFYPVDYVLFADSLVKYTDGNVENIALKGELGVNDPDTLKGSVDLTNSLYIIMQENVGGTLKHQLANNAGIDFNKTAWIDLGTMSWTVGSSIGRCYGTIPGGAKAAALDSISNILCSTLKSVPYNNVNTDQAENMTIALSDYGGGMIQLRWDEKITSSVNTSDKIKSALRGILLAYEKS